MVVQRLASMGPWQDAYRELDTWGGGGVYIRMTALPAVAMASANNGLFVKGESMKLWLPLLLVVNYVR